MRVVKLITVLLACGLVFAAVAVFPEKLCFDGGNEYTFYCGTSSADCQEVTVKRNAEIARLCLKEVCGEATVYRSFDLQSFLKKTGASIVAVEELSDSVNYYCTANLPYSVNLYGTEINLHISMRGDTAKVASPIIFGGY